MDALNKRVVQVVNSKGISKTEVATLLNIPPATLTHISTGRNKPGVDILQKILTHYPEISAEWLLMGHGEMLKAKNINKETIADMLTAIDVRMQTGINGLLGTKELLRKQIDDLIK